MSIPGSFFHFQGRSCFKILPSAFLPIFSRSFMIMANFFFFFPGYFLSVAKDVGATFCRFPKAPFRGFAPRSCRIANASTRLFP